MNTQLFIGEEQPTETRLDPITKGMFMKPKGGLWTSTWNEETHTSGWIEWCKSEEFGDPFNKLWWLLIPDEKAHIYTVDTHKDLKRLIRSYPLPNPMDYSLIDYEHVAQDYDAVHLTDEGQWATRLTYPENLYGWDVESTLWFRWCFADVRQIDTSSYTRESES